MPKKKVLVVYYSFTQQTKIQLKKLIVGLEESDIEVVEERLEPITSFEFPFRTNVGLAMAMIISFFRKRVAIHPISAKCFGHWDCVVLGGPTWSYHPSGPMLEFLDRYGKEVCGGTQVVPFISCRSYWRVHYWSMVWELEKCGAKVQQPIVFTHPSREPFRLIGLVLQLRGKLLPKEYSWFGKHYPGYGHSKAQRQEAMEKGREIAEKLLSEVPVNGPN